MSSILRGETNISQIDVERFVSTTEDWAQKNGYGVEISQNKAKVYGEGTYDFATFSWEEGGKNFEVTYDSDFREHKKVINGIQGNYTMDTFKKVAKNYGFQVKSENSTENETKLSMVGY